MTDTIIEDESGVVLMTHQDDGINQVTLISSKSSILQKKIKVPSSYKNALRLLSKS
jgi:hypothetical protein